MIALMPADLVMLARVLTNEFAVARVRSMNPMMVRTPVPRRPNILITTVPVARTFRIIPAIADFYVDAYRPCTWTQHDSSRRDG
jgi:hypothetical protein